MLPTVLPAYRALQRVARRAAPLAVGGRSKLARGIAGRRGAAEALVHWGRDARDPSLPCAWFHAPSVGEGLQARAVLEAWVAREPTLQVVYTHFSPSAEALSARMPAAFAGYLPWDLPEEMGPVLDALRPDALVFTKTEVWPVLVTECVRRDLPVALVGGVVPPGAGRARWPARSLLRSTWARIALVAAVGEDDAEGFVALGVAHDRVRVTGDPGIDSAAARARAADPDAPHLRPFREERRPTVVAGSTWPSDDRVLLPALEKVRRRVPEVRAILAPHEPTPDVVARLLGAWEAAGWRARTLTDVERDGAEGTDVVIVDRVGVLAHLYTVGDAAYVGGGFHDAGLHSVLEPAAARIPVSFGPRHANARAAGELLEAGGAREAADASALADALGTWLAEPDVRGYAGIRAFGYIHAHLGAADRTAALLQTLTDDTAHA